MIDANRLLFCAQRYPCLRYSRKSRGRSFTAHSVRKLWFLLCSRLNRLRELGAAERNDYILGDVYEDHETALNEHVA